MVSTQGCVKVVTVVSLMVLGESCCSKVQEMPELCNLVFQFSAQKSQRRAARVHDAFHMT